MQRATRIVRRQELSGRRCADSVTLDRAARFRRRVSLTSDGGRSFLIDLAEATYLADGDALALDDGTLVEVRAAAEDLLEIHAPDALALARIAWHLGNRHTPAEITARAIYIQPDHVLAAMVEGLGAHVHAVRRPFEPEGGAYGSKGPLAAGHGHSHGHGAHSHEGPDHGGHAHRGADHHHHHDNDAG